MSGVDWPPEFTGRTPARERSRNRSYDVTLSKAFSDLEVELVRLDVDDYDYSFDAQQRQRDGRPYSRARPDDPAFVLRWTKQGDQYAVGCDAYSKLRDNVRTVGLYVREKRKMEARPVATGQTEFSNLQLPSGEDTITAEPPAHVVLGIDPDSGRARIQQAFRESMMEAHPDHGGSSEAVERVKRAREQMMEGQR